MFQEDFISVAPKNAFLGKLIPYYYFYKTYDPKFFKQFYYYPHYRIGLTVHKNSDITWDENKRVTIAKTGKTTVLLTKNIGKRRIAEDRGIIDKICIAFEPLGINHFIDGKLNTIAKESISYFDHFGEEFVKTCDSVYKTNDINQKVSLLDDFFLSKYKAFEESKTLEAVKILLNTSEDIPIQKLAEKLGINRKMLIRLFQQHLTCSPKAFKQSIQFRKAFNQYKDSKSTESLAQIAYDNYYYDQSIFTNRVKKLTGQAPKSLFSSVKKIGNFDIYWTDKDSNLSQTTN